ncbi:MAG: hypothetical protein ABUT20_65365, partial [Bacteroidota bacterium]
VLVALGLVGVFISGARGSFVMYLFLLSFGLLGLRQFKSLVVFIGVTIFTVIIFMTVLLLTGKGQTVYEFLAISGGNFKERYEINKKYEQGKRLTGPLQSVFNFRGKYPLYGVGLGATYQGATQNFGTSYYVEEFGYYEEEAERIILEGGYLLFLLKVVLCILLIRYLSASVFFTVPLVFLTLFYLPIVYNVYNIIFL